MTEEGPLNFSPARTFNLGPRYIYHNDDNKSFDSSESFKRKRNHWYVKSHELTKQYHPLIFDAINNNFDRFFIRRQISQEIVWNAFNYHQSAKDKIIWLSGIDQKGEKYHFFIPYSERFQREYIQQQIKKLNKAWKDLDMDRGKSIIFCTLTIDPSRYFSIYESFKKSQKNVNSLLTLIRKRFGHIFRYVKVCEIQEKNTKNIHYHLAMNFNTDVYLHNEVIFNDVVNLIKNYWKIGFSDIKLVRESKKNGLKHYMLKYLLKSLSSNGEISENNAILWALNSRVFSFSNIRKWRYENDLITVEDGKNNSNGFEDPENSIIWQYEGLIDHERIGISLGLFLEKELQPDVLEILYRIRYKNNDNG